jgi:hypothetical protein
MPVTLFRADSRAPEAIAEAEGFGGRKPLSLDQARSIATRFFDGNAAVDLPDRAAPGLTEALRAREGRPITLGDMVRVAKAEKSGDTVHISTDLTPACGGYANGADGSGRPNLTYRIDVPADPFYVFKQNINGSTPAQPTSTVHGFDATIAGAVRPALVMDNPDPRQATMIAIVSSGDEVTFLTKVPQDWVTQFRTQDRAQASGFSAWQDMPARDQQQAPQVVAPQQVQAPVQAPAQVQAQVQAPPQVAAVVPPLQAEPVVVPARVEPARLEPVRVEPVVAPPRAEARAEGRADGAHPYQSPDHPYNRMLTQAITGVTALGEGNAYNRSEQTRLDAAVSLVHAARRGQIDSIDSVAYNHDGQRLFAVQGDAQSDAAKRTFVQRQDVQKPAVNADAAAEDLQQRQAPQAQVAVQGR